MRPSRGVRGRGLFLLGLAAVAGRVASPAAAQEVRIPVATVVSPAARVPSPPASSPAITLSDAVRLTVEHNPDVALAQQEIAVAAGRVQEAAGVFDPLLSVRTTVGWSHTPLQPFLRSREERKRLQLEVLADQFGIIDRALRSTLSGLSPRPPRCPVGFEFSVRDQSVRIDRQDPLERSLMGVQRDLGDTVTSDLRSALGGVGLSRVCTPASDQRAPQNGAIDFFRQANTASNGSLGLNQFLTNTPQFPHELIGAQQQLAYTVATRAALGRARLRDVPLDEIRRDIAFEASYSRPLRNGWFVDGQLRLLSQQHTFVDKALDPSFGGADDPILFPSALTLSMTVPLSRGGGRRTVEAPEQAAALTLRAETSRTRHTISENVLQTVLAYLTLVAAEERLRVLDESVGRQQQLLSLTDELVTAGEQPQMERDRARARAAGAAGALSEARLQVLDARVSLADAMGVDGSTLDSLPTTRGDFAQLPAIPNAAALTTLAMTTRQDRRALVALQEAAGLLSAAARADVRQRYDVTVSGGIGNTYDNPLFRFLPDELNPIYSDFAPAPSPGPAPARFSSPRGFGRSLTGRWEPFLGVSVSYEIPRANNRYRGRALQADSGLRRSTIDVENLERIIRDNLVNASGALRPAAAAIERRRFAIDRQRETLQGVLERFRAGDVGLLDTLVTEEDLRREQLQLVGDLLAFFSTVARLKFDAGELVRFEDEGTAAEMLVFSSADFIGR